MDNVVQNISIDNIIPGEYKPSNEERQKIEELAQLIKTFGLIDPILVRPKNGKYEIILGIDKYQAALIANQSIIPAIVKEVDDETFSRYSNIGNNQTISTNSLPTETFSTKEKNSDVINLSELSKINLEYERDDLKMNNGQFNNEMMNNNFGQPNMPQANQNQEPTFGGKFFPSLEDEPTNMNMMGGLNVQPTAPTMTPSNNNLIDLTDLSSEREATPMMQPNLSTPVMEPTPNFTQPQQNSFEMPNLEATPMTAPQNDTIINLDNLQNNNPAVKPISEPVSMDILNADFGAPMNYQMESPIPNPVSIEKNNMANPLPNYDMNLYNNPVQPNFNVNQQMMPPQGNQFVNTEPVVPTMNQMPELQPEVVITEPKLETNIEQPKNVTPVGNTIKNLVNSLTEFGYKININEEDLPNISKIIIEIEK